MDLLRLVLAVCGGVVKLRLPLVHHGVVIEAARAISLSVCAGLIRSCARRSRALGRGVGLLGRIAHPSTLRRTAVIGELPRQSYSVGITTGAGDSVHALRTRAGDSSIASARAASLLDVNATISTAGAQLANGRGGGEPVHRIHDDDLGVEAHGVECLAPVAGLRDDFQTALNQ